MTPLLVLLVVLSGTAVMQLGGDDPVEPPPPAAVQPARASISFTVEPADVLVTANGIPLGAGPIIEARNLEPGVVKFQAEAMGFETLEFQMTLEGNKEYIQSIALVESSTSPGPPPERVLPPSLPGPRRRFLLRNPRYPFPHHTPPQPVCLLREGVRDRKWGLGQS